MQIVVNTYCLYTLQTNVMVNCSHHNYVHILSIHSLSLISTEDAYRIDAEIDNEVVGLDILDTAGQEVFSAVRDRYMRDGEGFLLVYSLIERTTFLPMAKISEQIKRVKDTDRHVPIVLVGNKVCVNFVSSTGS